MSLSLSATGKKPVSMSAIIWAADCRLWSGVASCTSRLIHSLIFITYLLMARRIFALPRRALCSVSCDATPHPPEGRGGEPAPSLPEPHHTAKDGPPLYVGIHPD